jgi:hypothetical protein
MGGALLREASRTTMSTCKIGVGNRSHEHAGGAGSGQAKLRTFQPGGLRAMARWPRHVWTSLFTYGTVFVLFPLLCLLAYAWVRGWIF